MKPDVDIVEPVVKLKPDRRGPVEQGGCLGGDSVHVPRGRVEQGECLGVGGTRDVVVVEPVIELKPVKPDVVEKDIPAQLDATDRRTISPMDVSVANMLPSGGVKSMLW